MQMTGRFRLGILLVATSLTLLHAEGTKTLVWGDGKANRANIVFLAEGFTQPQQAKFVNYVSATMDSFFLYPPWSNFRKLCNVYAIGTVSADSGCDFPADGVIKDTYFGASYTGSRLTGKSGYVTLRSIDADSNRTPLSKITDLLKEHVPDHDILCIIVNDPYIPGAWAFQTANPRYVLIPIGYTHSPILMLHETNHIFGMVLDEYEIGTTTIGESKNTTATTQRDQIRWNAWIEPSTPVPTPETPEYSGVIGLFEGAVGCTTGWYRPKYECLMRTGRDGDRFCEICREELIVNICKTISLIDTFSPSNAEPVKNLPGAFLSVGSIKPDSFRLTTEWRVNGVLQTTAADTFKLADAALIAGVNTIAARIVDSSGMVRIPENRRYVADTVVWTVDNGTANVAGTSSLHPAEQRPRIERRSDGVHVLFSLQQPQKVQIAMWDVRGVRRQCIRTVTKGVGIHDVLLSNREMGPGVYIVRFSAGKRSATEMVRLF